MLSEDHRIGCGIEELEIGELETRLVDILLGNSGKSSVSSSQILAYIYGMVPRLTYKVNAIIRKMTQKMIR